MIVQPVRGQPRRHTRPGLALDADAVGAAVRGGRDGVVALEEVCGRYLQGKGEILAGAVADHPAPIGRNQDEGTNDLAFWRGALHDEVAPAIPASRTGCQPGVEG